MNNFSHFCPDLVVTVHEPFFGWGNSSTAGACFVVFWSQIFFLASLLEMLLGSILAKGTVARRKKNYLTIISFLRRIW